MSRVLPMRAVDQGDASSRPPEWGPVDRIVKAYTDRWGVLAILTLVRIVVSPPRGAHLVAQVVAALGIVLMPWLRQDWRYWALLTVATASGVLAHPLLDLDNHHFLELYWLAAMTIACASSDPREVLRRTARLLVGLVFVFAATWKVLAPDFVDASFLTYLLVADGNAATMMAAGGLQDVSVLEANRAALTAGSSDPTAPPTTVHLQVSSAAHQVAPVLTVLTIIIEAGVALAYLLPLAGRWRWLRDVSLFVFMAGTYVLFPVVAFGWLLVTMGLAASSLKEHRSVVAYLGAFVVVATLAFRRELLMLLGLG